MARRGEWNEKVRRGALEGGYEDAGRDSRRHSLRLRTDELLGPDQIRTA